MHKMKVKTDIKVVISKIHDFSVKNIVINNELKEVPTKSANYKVLL